jgi:hypothetical protein
MPNAHIELWRVGDVKCQWMADWRRLRIVSQGVVLSDQTLATPSEALTLARELRRFFKSISGQRDKRQVSGPGTHRDTRPPGPRQLRP